MFLCSNDLTAYKKYTPDIRLNLLSIEEYKELGYEVPKRIELWQKESIADD